MQTPRPHPAAANILATKLFVPPLREGWVARPRLVERLAAGLACRLTLVSAPAGFGKSSIVAEWVRRATAAHDATRPAVAWLSLDAAEDDPIRFWTYAVAALQHSLQLEHADDHTWKAALREVLGWLRLDPPAQLTFILDGLINAITADGRSLVLVLDDYHAISAATVHESVAYLLEHQPPNLHLVIITRTDPPLPLPRLRAERQLTEIRAEGLRFTHEEAAGFLNQAMALGLEPTDIAALEARSEGWIVGLQMAALALQGLALQDETLAPGQRQARLAQFIRAFTGSHRYILEYLVEEVLDRQPAAVRAFLLRTAILDRLCGPLCEAVVEGDGPGQAMLERLERANLFLVPLDGERRWFRYHRLFAELLGHRLRQEMPTQGISALHSRASRWYEQNGLTDAAVRHALQAQDFERAAMLAEQVAQATFFGGRMATLARWLEALPPEMLRARPRLGLYRSWVQSTSGQTDRANRSLRDSRAALQALPPSPENDALRTEMTRLLARNAALATAMSTDRAEAGRRALEELAAGAVADPVSRSRALLGLGMVYFFHGDKARADSTYAQALELALSTGNLVLTANTLLIRANGETYYGRLRQAERYCRQVIDLARGGWDEQAAPLPGSSLLQPEAQPPVGAGYLGLAEIACERNDLQDAARNLEQGLALCQEGGLGLNLGPGYIAQSRLRQALGDIPGALASLRSAAEVYRVEQAWPVMLQYVAQQVRLHLQMGEVEEAARWARRPTELLAADGREARLPIVLREVHQVILARLRLARGDAKEALALLEGIRPAAEAAGRLVPELCLLKALACRQMAGAAQAAPQARQEALAALQRSLEAAAPEGYMRLYLDEGPAVRELLAALDRQATLAPALAPYVRDLLSAFAKDQAEPTLETAQAPEQPATVSPASPSPHHQPLAEPLSPRELQVLNLISQGYSNQGVADELVISLHTAKKHASNILGKLGASSRVQAVARARQLGIIP